MSALSLCSPHCGVSPETTSGGETYERELLTQLVDAGLSARGSVAFACYDSPTTLPFLRRNELWIEIV